MEELLSQFEEDDGFGKVGKISKDDISQALIRFTEALRQALPLLDEEAKIEINDGGVDVHWLMDLVQKIPSELGALQLARAVVEASHLSDEGQKQEALFTALGASEEAMEILFQIGPLLPEIKQNISLVELGADDESLNTFQHEATQIDEEELHRQRLRQEALDAAQVAAIAQAGPEMQAKLLEGLGIKSLLITDGNSPINLFNTANGLITDPSQTQTQ